MTAQEVVKFYSQMEDLGIDVWLDGGWGIDALIGKQTRSHEDLDIVVQEKDVLKIKQLLESWNYKILERDDLADNYFHMADDAGHEIDFTAIHFDENDDGVFGEAKNHEMNPKDSFNGVGTIDGHKVKCVSLEYVIKFKLEHETAKHDTEDVRVLCKEFNLEIPSRYQ